MKGERMLSNDQVSSIVFFSIGVMICLASLPYELGGLHSPKTGFLPFVTGGTVCLLSLIGFVAATMKRREGEKWKSIMKGLRWDKPLITMGSLVVYALVLNFLGFILTTLIFMIFTLRFIEPQKWITVFVVSVLTSGLAYLLFEVWLETNLPKGIFGF